MTSFDLATDHLSNAVAGMAKCPPNRKIASLDASDLITVGDLRLLLARLRALRADAFSVERERAELASIESAATYNFNKR